MRAEHSIVRLARDLTIYGAQFQCGAEGVIVHVFPRTELHPRRAYLVEFDNPPSVVTLTDKDLD